MKKIALTTCVLTVLLCLSAMVDARMIAGQAPMPDASAIKEGDVIFQKSHSAQSQALKLATGSSYTHCGILLRHDGGLQVFEAANAVRWTPLKEWIQRGIESHYVIMRLRTNKVLPPAAVECMRKSVGLYAGKPYDMLFQWSDDKMYCSELVWKLYKRCAGIELGRLQSFYDYNLDHKAVQALIRARYGRELPAAEKVIAPSDLMNSGLLEVVDIN